MPLRSNPSTPTSVAVVIVVAPSVPPANVAVAAADAVAPTLSNVSGTWPVSERLSFEVLAADPAPSVATSALPRVPV